MRRGERRRDRADVDDAAVFARLHQLRRRLRREERALEVGVDDDVPARLVVFERRLAPVGAGAGHEDVEPAVLRGDLAERRGRSRPCASRRAPHALPPWPPDFSIVRRGLLRLVEAPAGDRRRSRPLRRGRVAHRIADAGRAAGHDRDAAVDVEIRHDLLVLSSRPITRSGSQSTVCGHVGDQHQRRRSGSTMNGQRLAAELVDRHLGRSPHITNMIEPKGGVISPIVRLKRHHHAEMDADRCRPESAIGRIIGAMISRIAIASISAAEDEEDDVEASRISHAGAPAVEHRQLGELLRRAGAGEDPRERRRRGEDEHHLAGRQRRSP